MYVCPFRSILGPIFISLPLESEEETRAVVVFCFSVVLALLRWVSFFLNWAEKKEAKARSTISLSSRTNRKTRSLQKLSSAGVLSGMYFFFFFLPISGSLSGGGFLRPRSARVKITGTCRADHWSSYREPGRTVGFLVRLFIYIYFPI